MRAVFIALTMSAFAVSSALAVDFSRATCEHPEMKKAMREDLIKGRAPNGQTLRAQGFDVVSITRTTDRSRSRDKLVCGFTAELSGYGSTESIRGQVTFRQFGSGKFSATYTFGY